MFRQNRNMNGISNGFPSYPASYAARSLECALAPRRPLPHSSDLDQLRYRVQRPRVGVRNAASGELRGQQMGQEGEVPGLEGRRGAQRTCRREARALEGQVAIALACPADPHPGGGHIAAVAWLSGFLDF